MSAHLSPINDRSRAPILSESDAMAVEWARLTWADAMREREERIVAELAGLRLDNQVLAEQNDDLGAALERSRDQLATAERTLTVIMLALVLATLASVVWLITNWK